MSRLRQFILITLFMFLLAISPGAFSQEEPTQEEPTSDEESTPVENPPLEVEPTQTDQPEEEEEPADKTEIQPSDTKNHGGTVIIKDDSSTNIKSKDTPSNTLDGETDTRVLVSHTYRGITPGYNDRIKGSIKYDSKYTDSSLTWVGFQMLEGKARVFIQISPKMSYTITTPDPKHIVVHLPQGTIPIYNDSREIIARYFPSPVDTIKANTVKHQGIQIDIKLKSPSQFSHQREGSYIFLDFPISNTR